MRMGAFSIASVFGLLGYLGTAAAAPQVLMVVTPTDELPLTCENGICATEVAAICLQPDRANPVRGARYGVRAADAGVRGASSTRVEDTMTLVGRDEAGRETALPTADLLRINAERDHYAVTLSVDQSVLQARGLASLAVRVTGNVLLFPKTDGVDPKPQTPSDVEIAETSQRRTAERILGKRFDTVEGASLVRTAMNALPRVRATTEAERAAAREAALRLPATPQARAHAKDAFFACRNVSDNLMIRRYDSRYGYRDCLGIMHDGLIDSVNKEYWNALKAGS